MASYETTADDRDHADPDSERVILRMADRFGNHNGGGLAFGPEGYLYIATGDGGGGGDPLDLAGTSTRRWPRSCASTSTRGPRLAVHDPGRQPVRADRWRPPGDLADRPAQPLAHPLRPGYGRPWIGDVGQNDREEIDVARAGIGGLDFGWNVMEGSACFRDPGTDCLTDALTLPVTEYTHDEGCSVTGGTVYRGEAQPAPRAGTSSPTTAVGGSGSSTPRATSSANRPSRSTARRSISAIAEDAAGELYATDHQAGELLRVVVDGA